MPWQVCLAQPKMKSRSESSDAGPASRQQMTYEIIDRVVFLNPSHAPIWDALKKAGNRHLVIDANHPEEAFQADVVSIADIKGDALAAIECALSHTRSSALNAEKAASGRGPLAKSLDRTFEEQREWLALRTLLVSAVIRRVDDGKLPPKAKVKRKRAFLLLDA
jgi:hypothetical protein